VPEAYFLPCVYNTSQITLFRKIDYAARMPLNRLKLPAQAKWQLVTSQPHALQVVALDVPGAPPRRCCAMQQPLRLYRSLLRAQRQFPQDAKRAASGQDMRSLLQDRIRKAFEQSRGASGAQVGQLMQAGETELQALRTITTSHFATEVRPSCQRAHPELPARALHSGKSR
jgi:hypothetical protein